MDGFGPDRRITRNSLAVRRDASKSDLTGEREAIPVNTDSFK
jgi:hypothetical protein